MNAFSFIGSVNIGNQINSKVIFYSKGAPPFSSVYPKFYYLLSHSFSPELNIRYTFLKARELKPQINFGFEPILHNSNMYSLSLGIICNIL